MPGSLLAVFIKQTHPRDAIWQSSCIVSFSMSTKSKSFQISPCVHNKFYCYQMRSVIILKWGQDKKRWKNDLFWKVRKIDHQLPKDRHTLTKSKTKTTTQNKSETKKRGRKGQRKRKRQEVESTEVMDGEWQAQLRSHTGKIGTRRDLVFVKMVMMIYIY